MRPRRKAKAKALGSSLIVLSLAAFVLFEVLAARAYPGGTYCDPSARGYRFWGNFLCDLTQPTTPNGVPNLTSPRLAQAAFACIAVAFAPFWWLVAELGSSTTQRWVRSLGLLSAVGTNAIAWLPSRSSPNLHIAVVFLSTMPGLFAAVIAVQGLVARARRSGEISGSVVAAFGTISLLFSFVDATGYAYAVATHTGCIPWLPALQKLAAMAVMAWMLAVAAVAARAL